MCSWSWCQLPATTPCQVLSFFQSYQPPSMTSPSLQPVNIQRLLRQNDKIADACHYAKSITQGCTVASWHEAGPASAASVSAAAKCAQQEAAMERQQMQQQRKLRLKQLLEQERMALEAELHQRGLALLKCRD